MLPSTGQLVLFALALCVPWATPLYTGPSFGNHVEKYRAEITQSVYRGKRVTDGLYQREESISHQIHCHPTDPDCIVVTLPRATRDHVDLSQNSYSLLMATKLLQNQLVDKYGMTPNTFHDFLDVHGFQIYDVPKEICYPPKLYNCDANSKYRTYDGSCNNLQSPSWGKGNIAFERLLPGKYADGVYAPPVSVSGNPLPSSRLLSRMLFPDKPVEDPNFTQMFLQFGQLFGHDVASIVATQTYAGGIKCCTEDGTNVIPPEFRHHACYPIHIPDGDKFYSTFKQQCMNFVRSMTILREDCTLGSAEQINSVSSYIDASVIYGTNEQAATSLRSMYKGQLRADSKFGRVFLPQQESANGCDKRHFADTCYKAGDSRVNQNPALSILQTIFLRQHNRIAEGLSEMNSHWDEERLYQETRSIMIAALQKIIYYDWLPLLINRQYLDDHHILLTGLEYSRDYTPKINPGVLNVFATGAYRHLHSMIHGFTSVVGEDRREYDNLRLRDHFNRPLVLEKQGYFDGIIRGLTSRLMTGADEYFTKEVTQYLFAGQKPYGLDLESFDIQRGRDHGLESYIEYRALCGFSKPSSFDDLIGIMPDDFISGLKELYEDVRDIDFFVGSTGENLVPGSLLGPTLQCIIGEQFYRWRVGDRFFFESDHNPNRLTPYQLQEIRKITAARIFCDNGDDIKLMQPNVFQKVFEGNPLVSCDSPLIPKIDLRAWKEA